MINIGEKLSAIFRRAPEGVLGDVTGAVDIPLNVLRIDLNQLDLQYVISSASGSWLDEWGSWFGVPRLPGEQDADYSKRIIATTTRPKNTVNAIMDALQVFLDDPSDRVEIYEPFNDIRKFSVSAFSGKDKFQDGSYFRNGVIDIRMTKYPDQSIMDAVNDLKSAGIKVYFTQLSMIGGDGEPVDMHSGIDPISDYWTHTDLSFVTRTGSEFSGTFSLEGRSGRKVLFQGYASIHELGHIISYPEQEIIFTDTYKQSQIYISKLMGQLYPDVHRETDLNKPPVPQLVNTPLTISEHDLEPTLSAKVLLAGSTKVIDTIAEKTVLELFSLPDDTQIPSESKSEPV